MLRERWQRLRFNPEIEGLTFLDLFFGIMLMSWKVMRWYYWSRLTVASQLFKQSAAFSHQEMATVYECSCVGKLLTSHLIIMIKKLKVYTANNNSNSGITVAAARWHITPMNRYWQLFKFWTLSLVTYFKTAGSPPWTHMHSLKAAYEESDLSVEKQQLNPTGSVFPRTASN